jgi:hypothetical protein
MGPKFSNFIILIFPRLKLTLKHIQATFRFRFGIHWPFLYVLKAHEVANFKIVFAIVIETCSSSLLFEISFFAIYHTYMCKLQTTICWAGSNIKTFTVVICKVI